MFGGEVTIQFVCSMTCFEARSRAAGASQFSGGWIVGNCKSKTSLRWAKGGFSRDWCNYSLVRCDLAHAPAPLPSTHGAPWHDKSDRPAWQESQLLLDFGYSDRR
ncbi:MULTISPECIES: hypothetical protein [Trichocoleus]|uniref:Uncharacterized protein n=1 Tax=Trichocoleus desertorum GB2-A4 TaxID=2933944 RepID=A0ABV0JH70_9CYAN|nr:hypothetical protein [Trichocoleus sp. FACHB-46]MBD1864847.1 hypothetical protein [Trichocoleus sp. FACHB-46]